MFLQRVQPIFNEVKGKMRNKMKNIAKVWRSSTAFLLSAFSFLILITSCSNELDEALQPASNGTLQFVVGNFPTFGESTQTRAIGTQDEGKTAWENGDQIIVTLISQKYGEQTATLTYDGISWSTEASLSYLENETPSVSVFYVFPILTPSSLLSPHTIPLGCLSAPAPSIQYHALQHCL